MPPNQLWIWSHHLTGQPLSPLPRLHHVVQSARNWVIPSQPRTSGRPVTHSTQHKRPAGTSPAGRCLADRDGALLRLKVDRDRVHAVAEATHFLRSVRKDMPEVGMAAGAADLGANHPVGVVNEFLGGTRKRL